MSNLDPSSLETFSDDDVDVMISKIPTMVDMFLDEDTGGQITEKEFDSLGIPRFQGNDSRSVDKDGRVLYQQRDVMMTAKASVRRRRDWLAKHPRKTDKEVQISEVNPTNPDIILTY